MSEGVFLAPRVADTTDRNSCKQFAQSTAFGTAAVVLTAKAGRLYRLSVVNSGAVRYFVQIHDKATAAVNTNVPIWEQDMPASGGAVVDFALSGLYFALGCSIAISTTKGVLTLAGATDASAYALYTTLP